MTILDAKLEFSDAQALASVSSGSSSVSTNVIDFGANGKDEWGSAQTVNPDGLRIIWNTEVHTALVGAAAIINATLVTKAADASISSSGTTIATISFPALSAKGTKRAVPIPTGLNIERYLGVLYTASGAKLTSAKFNSWVGLDHSDI